MSTRPPQVTDAHLRRSALVYLRQSSEDQVRHAVGSTAVQRDLATLLPTWGWPPELIETVDEDLGASGSQAGRRHGFGKLVRRLETGEVGLVAVVDINRLARNNQDLIDFTQAARRHDVLLFHGGQITDFRDPNAEFLGLILGLNASRENRARADFSRKARRKKAEQGIASTPPPVGYLAERDGTWRKDSDDRVRQVIELVFDTYGALGSIKPVLRDFVRQGIQLPGRRRHGSVSWGPPTIVRIHRILRNPAYAGIYVYGATRRDDGRLVKVPVRERVHIQDHHVPYVAHHRWADIQKRLEGNRWTIRAPLGKGDSLVQGLLRCTCHNRPFGTFYPYRERRDGTIIRRAYYRCASQDTPDAVFCAAARGSTLDHVVESVLLRTLRPPAVDLIQDVARDVQRQHEALARLRDTEVRRAEQAAAEAEREYHQADATQGLVKKRLAEKWEGALQRLQEIRTQHRLDPFTAPQAISPNELGELRRLVNDLPALWRHPRVTPEQRKQIARAMIKTIHVTPGREVWGLDIEWTIGDRTRVEFFTSKGVQTMVEQAYRKGETLPEIVKLLADRGVIQRSGPHIGKPYTVQSLRGLIYRARWERALRTEAYSYIRTRYLEQIPLRQIADELTARGIRHPGGRWTVHRVQGAVYRLRQGATRTDALPPFQPLTARVKALHEAGLAPREIVAQLDGEGQRTMQRRRFTANTVRQILDRLGLRPQTVIRGEALTAWLKKKAAKLSVPDLTRQASQHGFRTRRGTEWTVTAMREKLKTLGLPLRGKRRGQRG